jgi:hypothetical protein
VSKKQHRQKSTLPIPLIAAIIGGILLIVAALFVFASNSDGSGTPKLAVDQQMIDYGDVKFNVEKTFAIKVTNVGDGVLHFKEKPYIQVLEGC